MPHLNIFELLRNLCMSHTLARRSLTCLLHMVVREIPFCSIKFPLWEFLKVRWEQYKKEHYPNESQKLHLWQAVVCGIIGGGTASIVSLPFDKAYKRIYVEKVINLS